MTSNEIRLNYYLDETCVLCNTEATSRDELLKRMVDALYRKYKGFERDDVVKAVIERELQAPTVLASGLALPHARLAEISSPVLAVATSAKGVDFEASGEDPVHVVVLILTPKSDPGAYLRLMA